MSSEFYIAGIVVHAAPVDMERVARSIAALAGARIHATSAAGKLVVTLEAEAADEVLSRLEEARRLSGVVSAALVYQHDDLEDVGGAAEDREEIADERIA